MKNKTLAVWLSLLLAPIGLCRVYLYGFKDWITGCLLLMATVGWTGIFRVLEFGLDDIQSWYQIPWLGLCISVSCLWALIWGLKSPEQWHHTLNPQNDGSTSQGQTNWLTIMGLILALLVGAFTLMSTLAYCFQRYFESIMVLHT